MNGAHDVDVRGPSSQTGDMAILVSSHDAYHDLWPLFFHFFFKYWPQPTYPVYLISNHYFYGDKRVRPLLIGKDRGWSGNTRWATDQLEAEFVLYLQDDYFLSSPVDEERIGELVSFLRGAEGRYLNLRNKETRGQVAAHPLVRELEPSIEWMVDLQSAIWRRSYLRELAEPGWNPWHFEPHLNDLAKRDPQAFYTIGHDAQKVLPYVEAVMGRFWRPQGLEFLKNEGIQADFKRRPFPKAGQQLHRRYVRSLHKRRMEWRDRWEHMIRRGKPHCVEPYNPKP